MATGGGFFFRTKWWWRLDSGICTDVWQIDAETRDAKADALKWMFYAGLVKWTIMHCLDTQAY